MHIYKNDKNIYFLKYCTDLINQYRLNLSLIIVYLVYFIFLANPISTRVALGNSSLTALDVMFVGKFPRYNLKKLIK